MQSAAAWDKHGISTLHYPHCASWRPWDKEDQLHREKDMEGLGKKSGGTASSESLPPLRFEFLSHKMKTGGIDVLKGSFQFQ